VEQGWKAHGPGVTAVKDIGRNRDKFNLFKKRVKDWCHSWMTPGGVESEDEYHVSKQLFFAYLASEEVLDAVDRQQYVLDQASDFVLKHVIVYDAVFLFFKKKFLRHFNGKTSSDHEGTNFGIKEHAAAVFPSQRINVAGEKLCLQSTMTKGTQLESESTYRASSQSLWSQSPTASHVTTLAESIISHANGRTHDYAVNRTVEKSWEVHFVGHNNYCLETDRLPMHRNSPIPIFTRIRVVTNLDQFLCCDCGGQERIGLTCVHAMAVMENCFPEWAGPSHQDVSPRWWVAWLELAHKPNNHQITSSIMTVMTNEVPGPRIHAPIPASASYCPVTANRTALNRLKNYSREQLYALVPSNQVVQRRNAMRTTIMEEGMTQESYILGNNASDKEEDSEEEDNDFPSNQEDSLFASSLLLDGLSSNIMSSARDILKPQLNEVLQCLDALKSEASIQMATKVLDDLANQLRFELVGTLAPKRNIENCLTININIEENLLKKCRSYASKNC
jgi:hypothetical protein